MDLFQMSLSASVLILAIILIRACTLHHLPKRTFLVLWAVAALRLLVPYTFSSRLSIFSLLSSSKTPSLTEALQVVTASQVSTETSVSLSSLSANLSTAGSTSAKETAGLSGYALVWLVGFSVLALFFLVLHLKNRREFHTSLPFHHRNAEQWLQEHPLRRPLQIRCLDRISVPLTYGILRPVILLPKDAPWEKDEQLQCVLLHEYVHVRRLDAVWKAVLAILLCIHWFNPLVWCMYVLANRDIELSCDEAVVHALGQEKKEKYALTLIDLAASPCSSAPLINHFSKNVMEERIKSIMKTKKIRLMSIILAAALVAGAVIVFATSASETKAENTPGKTIVIPLEGIADMMDRHQERIDECREKYKSFSNYYSSLQDVTNYFSVPIEELPQDLRDQIAALKKDGDAYLIEETHNLDYLRQSSRSMNQRELTIFTENIPDYVAEKKVSQSLADETLNILSDLVYNYKFNQPTALDQLPDYIQVSMAHSGTDYWIYKLSMVSDIDNSVYHEFHFTYVNPPKEN